MAKRARVSIATVSRTINKSATVNPETAARVHAAIKELGYVPNRTAKALVSGKSHILGMIVSDITNPFFPAIIKGFEDVAIEHGYEIITTSTNYDLLRMEQCVYRLIQRSVDGVAIMTSEFDPALLGELARVKVPSVFLDVGIVSRWVSNIRVDYEFGIREAVTHLRELGHRQIGFISGPGRLKSAQVRKHAFVQALQDTGPYDARLIVEGNHNIDGGFTAMDKLVPLRPTAVLASNDLTAFGALSAIRRAGLSVPSDVSVVGFDDIQMAAFTEPPLTTVRLSRGDVAKAAFEALMSATQTKRPFGCEKSVTTQLIVRESTGPAPR